MTDLVIINFTRPGKGVSRYTEGLVDDNSVRIKTVSHIPPDISLKWCEEYWWLIGLIPHGTLIGSEMKYLFYHQWFSVMQLLGTQGDLLGFYVDIITPIRKVDGEIHVTDLFLDLWIAPGGEAVELDRDEFEESFQLKLITGFQHRKANQVIDMLKSSISNGDFFRLIQG